MSPTIIGSTRVGAACRRDRSARLARADRRAGAAPRAGAALQLNSDGRSTYREAEFGVHFTGAPRRRPERVVRAVAGASRSERLHHVLRLGPVAGRRPQRLCRRRAPTRRTACWRAAARCRRRGGCSSACSTGAAGCPIRSSTRRSTSSGRATTGGFPTYLRVELGVEHRFKIFKSRPWIGVRADNALNSFLPSDVQANLASPAFGSFYNSEYRQFRIQVRFER